MTDIREKYWFKRLCQLLKRITERYYGSKWFNAAVFQKPPSSFYHVIEAKATRAFQDVSAEYAGPIIFKKNLKTEGKVYVLLFVCGLSIAVYIKLLTVQTT